MKLLEVNHITKNFGMLRAVDDISFSLAPGEVLGLMGANGAGKTTLIRMICGLLKPDAGTLAVSGRPGYMCQQFSLVEELTAPENIDFYGALYGLSPSRIAKRRAEIVHLLALEPYCHRPVRQLSSGWRQAVSFSIAVLPRPSVLILDEPSSGLDPLSRGRIWNLIRAEAAEGTGILLSTHYLEEAQRCDRLCILNAGKIIASGAPGDIASDPDGLLTYFR